MARWTNLVGTLFGVASLGSLVLGQSSSAPSVCYQKNVYGTQVVTGNHYPCNNTQVGNSQHRLCCFQGDICGEDSICHYTHPLAGGSGYYIGGCTDPTYQDASCSQHCTNYPYQDIAYNTSTNEWACCGDGADLCPHPTNDTFQAIALTAWSALPSTPTSAPTASSTSTTSTSTTSPSSASPSSSASGLSTGAQAGIGVGVGLGALVLIGLVGFLVVRKRRHRNTRPENQELMGTGLNEKAADGDRKTVTSRSAGAPQLPADNLHQPPMYADPRTHEVSGEARRAELSG